MAEKEKAEKKQERFVSGEVPTQFSPAIIDTTDKSAYSIEAALVKIMNDLEEIKGFLLK